MWVIGGTYDVFSIYVHMYTRRFSSGRILFIGPVDTWGLVISVASTLKDLLR